MVSGPVILKKKLICVGNFHPTHKQTYQENCHDNTPKRWNNETKHKGEIKNNVYTDTNIKSSSPDD